MAAVMAAAPSGADFSDLREIKKQLLSVAERSRERGLQHSGKWAAELAFALEPLPLSELPPPPVRMLVIWMPTRWPSLTSISRNMTGLPIFCVAARARKLTSCTCTPDIW
uniref:Uncharacterized protein n=1 Tax=Malurus cyaneus samueli TaxID=2593467 RepID=A0A8C5X928_9PASS